MQWHQQGTYFVRIYLHHFQYLSMFDFSPLCNQENPQSTVNAISSFLHLPLLQVDLTVQDVQLLVNTLVYDGRLEEVRSFV